MNPVSLMPKQVAVLWYKAQHFSKSVYTRFEKLSDNQKAACVSLVGLGILASGLIYYNFDAIKQKVEEETEPLREEFNKRQRDMMCPNLSYFRCSSREEGEKFKNLFYTALNYDCDTDLRKLLKADCSIYFPFRKFRTLDSWYAFAQVTEPCEHKRGDLEDRTECYRVIDEKIYTLFLNKAAQNNFKVFDSIFLNPKREITDGIPLKLWERVMLETIGRDQNCDPILGWRPSCFGEKKRPLADHILSNKNYQERFFEEIFFYNFSRIRIRSLASSFWGNYLNGFFAKPLSETRFEFFKTILKSKYFQTELPRKDHPRQRDFSEHPELSWLSKKILHKIQTGNFLGIPKYTYNYENNVERFLNIVVNLKSQQIRNDEKSLELLELLLETNIFKGVLDRTAFASLFGDCSKLLENEYYTLYSRVEEKLFLVTHRIHKFLLEMFEDILATNHESFAKILFDYDHLDILDCKPYDDRVLGMIKNVFSKVGSQDYGLDSLKTFLKKDFFKNVATRNAKDIYKLYLGCKSAELVKDYKETELYADLADSEKAALDGWWAQLKQAASQAYEHVVKPKAQEAWDELKKKKEDPKKNPHT